MTFKFTQLLFLADRDIVYCVKNSTCMQRMCRILYAVG